VSPFPASLASVDGEIMPAEQATIPATDEGLLRGDGVFEVIRVYAGTPFALDEHLARMERSAANLRLPLDLEAVRAEAYRLLAQAGAGPDHEQLRIVVTRGGRRLLLTEPIAEMPDVIRLTVITYSPTRVLDGVKLLSYAANMLATRLAQERGFDEALFVTPHGHVLEAPRSSLFWVKDGRVLTPPLEEHILASITRKIVLELSSGAEQECTLPELLEADEVFIAGTSREVHPVAAVDDRPFDAPGAVSARLLEEVAEYIRARVDGSP
jgi:branched-chain amino acid aminotransferase